MAINPGNVNYQVGDMLTAAQYNTTHNSLVKAIEEDNSRVITPSSPAPTDISSGHWLFATIPGVYANFPFVNSSNPPLEVASMAIIRYNGSGWDKYEISASGSGGGDGGPVQSFVYFNLNSTYNSGDIVGYNYPISFEGTTFEFLEFYRCLSDGTSGILPTSEDGHWVSIGSRYLINAILGELSGINMGMQNMHARVYSLERIARNDRIVIPPIENEPSFRHPNFEILNSRSGSSSSLVLNTLGEEGDRSNALTVYHSAAIRTGNNLIVSGNAVFDNNATVSRRLNTDQLNVTGNASFEGNVSFEGNIENIDVGRIAFNPTSSNDTFSIETINEQYDAVTGEKVGNSILAIYNTDNNNSKSMILGISADSDDSLNTMSVPLKLMANWVYSKNGVMSEGPITANTTLHAKGLTMLDDNVTVGGDLHVEGNLVVSGSTIEESEINLIDIQASSINVTRAIKVDGGTELSPENSSIKNLITTGLFSMGGNANENSDAAFMSNQLGTLKMGVHDPNGSGTDSTSMQYVELARGENGVLVNFGKTNGDVYSNNVVFNLEASGQPGTLTVAGGGNTSPIIFSELGLSMFNVKRDISVNGDINFLNKLYKASDYRSFVSPTSLIPRGELSPVSYTSNGNTHFGFSAQEVNALYPELVKITSSSGRYLLDYQGIIAVIYAELKALREEVALLRGA